MNRTVTCGKRFGIMSVPASKSQAHRMLICAALSENESIIGVDGLSTDISATKECLNALGAGIVTGDDNTLIVHPVKIKNNETVHLYCRESGSTLRFLIPVCGALGRDAVFHMEGRLPGRPVDDLIRACTENGMIIEKKNDELHVSGRLSAGDYTIRGDVSSQFISGLLFALPILNGKSTLRVTGQIESSLYIEMTEEALRRCNIRFRKERNTYIIDGGQKYEAPSYTETEKDWSGAAFPLCMGAFSLKGVMVSGLDIASIQGDRRIIEILSDFGAEVSLQGTNICVRKGKLESQMIDASDVPDLVPVISVVAAVSSGTTRIVGAGRLRLKESDRIKSTVQLINSLGGLAEETDEGLIIRGVPSFSGGFVSSYGDHRIAMAAACAACASSEDIVVSDAECTEKSFPGFWKEFDKLEADK